MINARWYLRLDQRIRSWTNTVHDIVGWPFQNLLRSRVGQWIRRNTEPSHWTLLRFPMAIVILILLYLHHDYYAIGLYALSVLTDRFDGEYARMDNKCSDFGTLLDTIADSVMQAVVLLSLNNRYPILFHGHQAWRLPLIAVCLEVARLLGGLILHTLPQFSSRVHALVPNMSGKFKMAAMAVSVLAILCGVTPLAQQLMLAAIVLSVYSMLRHLYDARTSPAA